MKLTNIKEIDTIILEYYQSYKLYRLRRKLNAEFKKTYKIKTGENFTSYYNKKNKTMKKYYKEGYGYYGDIITLMIDSYNYYTLNDKGNICGFMYHSHF